MNGEVQVPTLARRLAAAAGEKGARMSHTKFCHLLLVDDLLTSDVLNALCIFNQLETNVMIYELIHLIMNAPSDIYYKDSFK